MTDVASGIRRVRPAPSGPSDPSAVAPAATSQPSASDNPAAVSALEQRAVEANTLAAVIHRAIVSVSPTRIEALRVTSRGEEIVLEGRCHSYHCKQIAQTVAMDLARGIRVQNVIEVLLGDRDAAS